MKTVVGRSNLEESLGPVAVTIGTFDGVHVGHRALIEATRDRAQSLGVAAAVLTWDRHPAETLRPEATPPLLTSQGRKVELLEDSGVDLLVVLEFDKELSRWPPERFVDDVLVAGLAARAVLVGRGWRFGRKAAGDVALLETLGRDRGFETTGLDLAEIEGEPVSSSRVRAAVAEGNMRLAQKLLGRTFEVTAPVVSGDDRGKELGWPTANLVPEPKMARPPRGVYAGRAHLGDATWQAAINVGVNPTFGGDPASTPVRIEAYLLDFEGDLYGRPLTVEFHERLRDEIKFPSISALTSQIAQDVEATRRLT